MNLEAWLRDFRIRQNDLTTQFTWKVVAPCIPIIIIARSQVTNQRSSQSQVGRSLRFDSLASPRSFVAVRPLAPRVGASHAWVGGTEHLVGMPGNALIHILPV